MKPSEIIKGRAYKLSQFDGNKIEVLMRLVIEKEVRIA